LGAPYEFRILYSKTSHETNKQWTSAYKKDQCSLDPRDGGTPKQKHNASYLLQLRMGTLDANKFFTDFPS
jgi:hypothetical protein